MTRDVEYETPKGHAQVSRRDLCWRGPHGGPGFDYCDHIAVSIAWAAERIAVAHLDANEFGGRLGGVI
jgi:hypothetical protein